MSDTRELVRMANQIADFFGAYPEAEAVEGIADHIKDFWTPAMRSDMARYMDGGGAGVRPLAARALSLLSVG